MFNEKDGDIFDSQSNKKTDDEWLNFVGYGVLLCALLLGLFFALPAILLSIIFSVVAIKFLSKKMIYALSTISFIGFLGTLYLWSYPPLFQFGSFWRGIMPKIVLKIEEIVQNGEPFKATYQSYLMLLLVSLALVAVFVFLTRQLSKNWFTKEKEQEKDDYLESDSYQKIYKSKAKYLRQLQEKYRHSKDKLVCLGMDIYKKSVTFQTKDLFTHGIVQGTTGTGKTFMMFNIMEEALREDMGTIFIDGKGDPKTEKEIKKITDYYGKKLYVFSERSKWHYNPVKYGKATAITDRLMAVMDWSDSFYEKESENTLQQVIMFVQEYIEIEKSREHNESQGKPLKNDLETYLRFLSLSEIANYLFLEQSEFILDRTERVNAENGLGLSADQPKPTVDLREKPHQKYIQMFFNKKELTYEDIENIEEDNKDKIN